VYSQLARYAGILTESPDTVSADTVHAPLLRLAESFGLSSFELEVLLLCAGAEVDSRFTDAFAALGRITAQQSRPTFALALACLKNPHLSALSPLGPLRHWQLLEVESAESPLAGALRIDPRILLYLLDVPAADEALAPLIRRIAPRTGSPMERTHAMELAIRYWREGVRDSAPPRPLWLAARGELLRLAVAQDIAKACGFELAGLRASEIPPSPLERDRLARRWAREALLTRSALYIESGAGERAEEIEAVIALCGRLQVPVAVGIPQELTLEHLPGFRVPEPSVSLEQRRTLWSESLGPLARQLNGTFDRVVEQFNLSPDEIAFAGMLVNLPGASSDSGQKLWHICRQRSRRSLDQLARRIDTRAQWDDLILPDQQKRTLRQMVTHVRERSLVYRQWGFVERSARGLAITAMFSGNSGTGKTMAAEVIAATLELDLFQVDLSTVVSKYIGETEKNLRRIFDAADESGAVLLFDEADALFGKRTDVRDSHDRYANLEVSYLLQRMEAYEGVAILTTNMKHVIDPAFVRRIRFIVQFQFPDAARRAVIWSRIFPARTPIERLDYERLAQLNVPGGVIRNIALQAAFFAADDGQPIGMKHILEGARSEYGKLERSLTPAEIRGWI
jgi:hypothetical protein